MSAHTVDFWLLFCEFNIILLVLAKKVLGESHCEDHVYRGEGL